MNTETTDINEIIIRYLEGSSTLDEKQLLLQWLRESDKNLDDFNITRDLWLSCEVALGDEAEINMSLNRLRQRILAGQQTEKAPRRRPFIGWYQTAAVILVLLGMGYWLSVQKPAEPQMYVQNQLITAKGSKGQFVLPDGSIVWLNTDSKLIYPENFSDGKREVELVGEGYFQVVEDEKKPFIVKTGDLDVEVLGTSFDVSSYPYMDKIDIVLLSGKVKVNSDIFSKPVMLEPNQLLSFDKKDIGISLQSTKANLHIDWIKDRLVFDNTSLSDIIISLQGWYNVVIDCPKAYADKNRLSFTVRGENIDETLKAMSLIIPIKYTINENRITITLSNT